MIDTVKDALNDLIAHWNTKSKQSLPLAPDWHAWICGVSEHIDKVIAAYEAQQGAHTTPATGEHDHDRGE